MKRVAGWLAILMAFALWPGNIAAGFSAQPSALPAQVGQWTLVSPNVPIRTPIHAALLRTGRVLLVAGSGNDPDQFAAGLFQTVEWNPKTSAYTQIDTPWDVFCAGNAYLADGTVLFDGGTAAYPDPPASFKGTRKAYRYDPIAHRYVAVPHMTYPRWYPTALTLGSGNVFTIAGLDGTGLGMTTVPEIYVPNSNSWVSRPDAGMWPMYPSMFLAKGGRLIYTGGYVFGSQGVGPGFYDVATSQRTPIAGLSDPDYRDQSASVILPPAQAQRFMILGGGQTGGVATKSTSIIDLTRQHPAFVDGPPMAYPRIHLNAVLLPDRTVFVAGGGRAQEKDPVYASELYTPAQNSWKTMASETVARLYHSLALLLPDGRVLEAGSNPDGSWEQRMEVYSPPYLFKGARPSITSAPRSISYGSRFRIQATQSAKIKWVSLIRPSSVTHSLNTDQRLVNVPFTVASAGTLRLSVTGDPTIAPPGWYMLFVTNTNGVPSVARWIHLG